MPPPVQALEVAASIRPLHRLTLVRHGINPFDRKESQAMKTLLVTIAPATLLAVLVGVGTAGPVHWASGGGTIEYAGALNTHAFTAQIDADGTVKGQAEFQLR